MKISVAIASVGRSTLKRCVDSLQDADEIVVCDDLKLCCVDAYNDAYRRTTGDMVLHTNDRSFFDPGWRPKVEAALKKIDYYGVVSFNTNIVLAGCLSREYIEHEQLGYLFWPEYLHHHCDQEQGELARQIHHYVEALGFIHYSDKTELDLSGEAREPDAYSPWDTETYYLREKLKFPREFVRNIAERNKIAYSNL